MTELVSVADWVQHAVNKQPNRTAVVRVMLSRMTEEGEVEEDVEEKVTKVLLVPLFKDWIHGKRRLQQSPPESSHILFLLGLYRDLPNGGVSQ